MKKQFKKLLSILMVFCMVMGMMPVQAFATMVPTVTLDQEELTLEFGKTATLNATIDLYEKYEPSWGSSNESVATVDSNGVVTAVGIGEAEITVTASPRSDVMEAIAFPVKTCKVTVVPAIISEVSATVTLPAEGANPVETGTPGDSSYKIIRVRFSEKDPETGIYTPLESTDTFEAGKTYMVNVLFRANSGYAIDRNTVSASINGQTAAWWGAISDGYGSQYFYIEYTVPEDVPAAKTPINFVKVSDITEPVIGATPDFDITLTGDGVVFDEEEYPDGVAWYKVNMSGEFVEWVPMDEDTEFGAGLYELQVALKPEAEYEFTDATKFYYNEYELPAWHDTYESNYDWWADEAVAIILYFTLESATPVQPAVALNESAITLTAGETETLVPTITPADLPNYALSWKTSDESVATVDSDGKVTAVAPGTATITVTLNNNVSRSTAALAQPTATCVVTVVPQDVPQEPTTSVTVTKVWNVPETFDRANLPQSVMVALYAGDDIYGEPVTLNEENNWRCTWSELPVTDGVVYSVAELNVPDEYEVTIEETGAPTGIGFTITNTYVPEDVPELEPVVIEIPVSKKVANGGNVAFSGEETFEFEVTVLNSNVEEFTVEGNTIKVTNGEGGSTTIKITVPAELYDYLCDEGVMITEVAGGTDGWTYSTERYLVMISPNGQYYMLEGEVEDTAVDSIVFTNTYTKNNEQPEVSATTSVTVTKVWDAPEGTVLPESVEVYLLANGQEVTDSRVSLDAGNQWTYTWLNLDIEDSDHIEIEYSVDEVEVKDYTKTVEKAEVPAGIGFTIKNTKDSGEDEEGGNGGGTTPTTPSAPSTPSVPDTSDNTGTLMYLTAMVSSTIALVFVLKKKKYTEE